MGEALDVIIKISITSLAGLGVDKYLRRYGKSKLALISNGITAITIVYFGITFIIKLFSTTMEVFLKW